MLHSFKSHSDVTPSFVFVLQTTRFAAILPEKHVPKYNMSPSQKLNLVLGGWFIVLHIHEIDFAFVWCLLISNFCLIPIEVLQYNCDVECAQKAYSLVLITKERMKFKCGLTGQ